MEDDLHKIGQKASDTSQGVEDALYNAMQEFGSHQTCRGKSVLHRLRVDAREAHIATQYFMLKHGTLRSKAGVRI
jgi:hypothetical protein